MKREHGIKSEPLAMNVECDYWGKMIIYLYNGAYFLFHSYITCDT